jgi:hypothetical protein
MMPSWNQTGNEPTSGLGFLLLLASSMVVVCASGICKQLPIRRADRLSIGTAIAITLTFIYTSNDILEVTYHRWRLSTARTTETAHHHRASLLRLGYLYQHAYPLKHRRLTMENTNEFLALVDKTPLTDQVWMVTPGTGHVHIIGKRSDFGWWYSILRRFDSATNALAPP